MSSSMASHTSTASAAAPTKVTSQGGVLDGLNPSTYRPTDPLVTFIIQAAIIIIFCRILHYPLSKIRQPRVIAEVIGGILLGPTVFGRIPGFTAAIFPDAGMPILNMAANLGLVLFLFLVGLEVDLRLIINNWRIALSVGIGGMVLPFGLGGALGYGLYHQFGRDPGTKTVEFGVFLLFIGTAFAITAFPVLARILTELKLLQSNVGVIVLSAGVGNDVVGWVLLALTVALVNAGTGLTALWVLFCAIGWILFLVYAVRPVFVFFLRRSGSLSSSGPTQGMVALTIVLVLTSAFFTDIIGVHAIFGAFLVGLICPHEGGFAVRLTEKVEDLVTVLLLPLYFALSGLRTNIGLLDDGIVWGYVVAVITVAFTAKVCGGTIAARLNGLLWRESFAIGTLMSCKGLVELIVLNIGLQAGIISKRVFTIFVVMALVTTFATTPLTLWIYPPTYQRKVEAWRRGEIDWDGTPLINETVADKKAKTSISKITVLLRLDSLPSMLSFVSLLKGQQSGPPPIVHRAKASAVSKEIQSEIPHPRSGDKIEVHGLRMVEIGERNSAVMQVAEESEFSERDPVVSIFRSFGRLFNFACSAGLSLLPEGSMADVLAQKTKTTMSDLLVIPWSESGTLNDTPNEFPGDDTARRFEAGPFTSFVHSSLELARCDTAVFINRGFGGSGPEIKTLRRQTSGLSIARVQTGLQDRAVLPVLDVSHHIFFPFIGGADDRAAMRMVLQLIKNPNVTATIVQIAITPQSETVSAPEKAFDGNTNKLSAPSTPDRRTSETDIDANFYMQLAESLPQEFSQRVVFETIETTDVLPIVIRRMKEEVGQSSKNAGDLVILGRSHEVSFSQNMSVQDNEAITAVGHPSVATETKKTLGELAEAVLLANVKASVLVFKASEIVQ